MTRTILAKAALAALLTSAAALAPAQAQWSQLTAPELNILLGATYGNTNGLQLSQIGAQQAQAPQVRAYAQRSIEQTEQAITDLKALAEKVGAKGAAAFFAERGQGADPERAARWLEARPEA